MATIGLSDVYYALLTSDEASAVAVYQEPVHLIGAINCKVNPGTSTSTLFYDNGPGDTAATLGEISLELNLADLPLSVQAILLGHTYSNGVLKKKGSDTPPWVGIGFRTLKSNGKYRYYWLVKGKFATQEEDHSTKADSIEFKTPTITGAFVKRDSDDQWERVGDQDEVSFTNAMQTAWFTSAGLVDATSVLLAAGSAGTAGNGTITGLTAGTKYKAAVGVGSTTYYAVSTDGFISSSTNVAYANLTGLTGTAITGLANGMTYHIVAVTA